MMVLPLLLANRIMGTSVQELSRMLYVGMLHKLAIMYPEDLVGIAMDSQLNMKLIRPLELPTKDKFLKWELISTIMNAVQLS